MFLASRLASLCKPAGVGFLITIIFFVIIVLLSLGLEVMHLVMVVVTLNWVLPLGLWFQPCCGPSACVRSPSRPSFCPRSCRFATGMAAHGRGRYAPVMLKESKAEGP